MLIKTPIITTSFDDGQKTDFKLAKLLAKYYIKSTFYVPTVFNGSLVLDYEYKKFIKKSESFGVEIGGHSSTHPVLTSISYSRALKEIKENKDELENIQGREIFSFAYPYGKFNTQVAKIVKKAGYRVARTTVSFRLNINNSIFMPVSFQLYPHSKYTIFRHILKEFNLVGLKNWIFDLKTENDFLNLTALFLELIEKKGGILHIFGHSWEIEKYSLWPLLEKVLKMISNRRNALYLNNKEAIDKYFKIK